MNFVVAYDVNTQTRQGERRLRRVARACEGYGQRVQYSVFEIVCSRVKLVRLVAELERIIDPASDCVRIYPLDADGFEHVITMGLRRELPHDAGWVL